VKFGSLCRSLHSSSTVIGWEKRNYRVASKTCTLYSVSDDVLNPSAVIAANFAFYFTVYYISFSRFVLYRVYFVSLCFKLFFFGGGVIVNMLAFILTTLHCH